MINALSLFAVILLLFTVLSIYFSERNYKKNIHFREPEVGSLVNINGKEYYVELRSSGLHISDVHEDIKDADGSCENCALSSTDRCNKLMCNSSFRKEHNPVK